MIISSQFNSRTNLFEELWHVPSLYFQRFLLNIILSNSTWLLQFLCQFQIRDILTSKVVGRHLSRLYFQQFILNIILTYYIFLLNKNMTYLVFIFIRRKIERNKPTIIIAKFSTGNLDLSWKPHEHVFHPATVSYISI